MYSKVIAVFLFSSLIALSSCCKVKSNSYTTNGKIYNLFDQPSVNF